MLQPADRAWIAPAAGVIAWGALADEMLSQASARYKAARPVLWPATIIYTAGHLMHVWPEKVDLFTLAAKALGR